MRVVHMALKDLRQIVRERTAFLFLLAMPLVFTLFFGLIIPAGDDQAPRLRVGVVDGDGDGPLSAVVVEMLDKSGVVEVVAVPPREEERAARDVAGGRLAALLVLPQGFGREALAGGQPKVRLVIDSADPVGHGARTVIETAVMRALGAAEVARLSAEAMAEARPLADAAARDIYLQDALRRAVAAWDDVPMNVALRAARAQREPEPTPAGGFAQSSPGMIVQFAIYGLMTAAMVLVVERKVGALQRLLTTPASRGEIVAGKVLAMTLLVLGQQAILIGFGQVAFGVNYMHAPLATLLVMVALALWAASLGLLIGAVAREEERVIMYSLVAMFVFAALGGAWFPLEITGETFAAIGQLLPSAWAMDGFQNIVLRGQGLASVVTPVLVLLGYAGAFFGLAVWRLRFE
jgi:ABC-2 type transport system permease protein